MERGFLVSPPVLNTELRVWHSTSGSEELANTAAGLTVPFKTCVVWCELTQWSDSQSPSSRSELCLPLRTALMRWAISSTIKWKKMQPKNIYSKTLAQVCILAQEIRRKFDIHVVWRHDYTLFKEKNDPRWWFNPSCNPPTANGPFQKGETLMSTLQEGFHVHNAYSAIAIIRLLNKEPWSFEISCQMW